ncbi:MAG: DUF1566 domain-containing protein [Bacteroidales bacterium]|jgi:uncharacterized protein (TIGR02145 family)|nr:DUF1566 domain-containing protein [Bacteroidales bacterium]
MYRALLIAAASAVVLSSCTNNEIDTNVNCSDGRTPIVFSTYVPRSTRYYFAENVDIATLAGDEGFSITAKNVSTGNLLFENQIFQVTDLTQGTCEQENGEMFFWPGDSTTAFYAIYPRAEESYEDGQCWLDAANDSLVFTPAAGYDVIAAYTTGNASSNGGSVQLNFKHLAAKVILAVKCDNVDYQYKLTAVSLTVPKDASYKFTTQKITALTESGNMTFTPVADVSIDVSETLVKLDSLMVAADGTPGTTCRMEVSFETNIGGQTQTYTKTADVTLVAGYVNTVNVTLAGNKPLKVTGSLSNWTKLLDANGHDYVDLGLPSGRLWATCNIGAVNPEDYGDYFAWGEKMGYTGAAAIFSWDSYEFGSGANITKYWTSTDYGTIDNRTVLESVDDAACVILEGDWRIPTYDEWQELLDNCTSQWTTLNNVNGRLFTSNYNENTIFLPAAGNYTTSLVNGGRRCFYWSSTLVESNPICAWGLNASSSAVSLSDSGERYLGRPIRAVMAP